MRLILLRHGQTAHNKAGRIQGRVDLPLNDTGVAQAQKVAEFFSTQDSIKAVYSSPLLRAVQTAEFLAAEHDLPVITDDRLLERSFGPWEGLTREEIEAGWPEHYEDWVSGRTVKPGILEDRREVGERTVNLVEEAFALHADASVVMVSHGAALNIMITALLGLDPELFRQIAGMQNCHWAELLVTGKPGEKPRVRLLSLNLAPGFS